MTSTPTAFDRFWCWLIAPPKPHETLQQTVERVCNETVERWSKDTLPGIVDRIYGRHLPDTAPRDQTQFIWRIAAELARHGMKPERAFAHAGPILREYLTDEKIAFGDPNYGWTGHDAVIVAREYELDHWETA